MKMYTITAIKKDGLRHLAFDNNSRNTFKTKEQANEKMTAVIENNQQDRVIELVGDKLEVTEVDCYESGDCKRTIF
jgi:hypothetical protein